LKNIKNVYMSLYADTLSWFRVNQYLFLFFINACLAEKNKVPILTDLCSNLRSTALEASTLTFTPSMRSEEIQLILDTCMS